MRRRGADEEDYVLRVIRQAAEALRLLRARLAGGREAPAVVRGQAAAAVAGLLGRDAPLLTALDAHSAVRLVGDTRRIALWAGLLDVLADAARRDGQSSLGAEHAARAASLRAAAGIEAATSE